MRTIAIILLVGGLVAAEPAPVGGAATTTLGESDYQKPDDKAMLGVTMAPTSSDAQARNGIDADSGVEITNIYSGTAAEQMGLQNHDVIMDINGSPISSMTDLRNEVALTGVGGQVDLVVLRNGQPVVTSGNLGEWPPSIPYEPIDAAAERRFRDWQGRRLERSQQAVASISKQLENLERAVNASANGGKQQRAPGSLTPIEAAGMPVSDALPGLPAWKLSLHTSYASPPPATAAPPNPAKTAVAWDARILLGTPAPGIL